MNTSSCDGNNELLLHIFWYLPYYPSDISTLNMLQSLDRPCTLWHKRLTKSLPIPVALNSECCMLYYGSHDFRCCHLARYLDTSQSKTADPHQNRHVRVLSQNLEVLPITYPLNTIFHCRRTSTRTVVSIGLLICESSISPHLPDLIKSARSYPLPITLVGVAEQIVSCFNHSKSITILQQPKLWISITLTSHASSQCQSTSIHQVTTQC